MIDFQTVTIEMNTRAVRNIERLVDGRSYDAPFSDTGVMAGSGRITFGSRVIRAEASIKSFHLETEKDHNIKKLKIEPNVGISGNTVNIGVEGVFMDDSPEDDYINRRFIMSTRILVIVERQ